MKKPRVLATPVVTNEPCKLSSSILTNEQALKVVVGKISSQIISNHVEAREDNIEWVVTPSDASEVHASLHKVKKNNSEIQKETYGSKRKEK